jgi:uncharacterized cupin superfamily protein
MKKVNLRDVPWEDWSSPGGKFHGISQTLSLALGAKERAIPGEGGHPFDLEHARLLPGKAGCPFHAHWTQFEFYIITKGHGTMRHGAERREVRAGDAMMLPPFEAHQLVNTSDGDLEYLLVADNPHVDVWQYPDSNKWGFRPHGGIFLRNDVDYYVGEEDGAEQRPPRPAPATLERTLARFVAIATIPEVERRSPKGKYHSFVRDISLAVGGIRDAGTWGGGHPFDVQQRRVPPGAAVCPLHVHTTQSELFVILNGTATVRSDGEKHTVAAGDVFFQPPGTAHQIINTGSEDFLFYVIADNVPADICHYPDSQKWAIAPQRKCFRMVETDYFDGEE